MKFQKKLYFFLILIYCVSLGKTTQYLDFSLIGEKIVLTPNAIKTEIKKELDKQARKNKA